ncbi:MAG: aldo/keto reductase [Nitrospirota bacterium]|jgi:predicted aldo/keto reductase-like oxidoreductase
MNRRNFLRFGVGAAAWGVAGMVEASQGPPAPADRIQRYVPLGRTGLKISDISFGSASSSDPALVRHALARGVNYFDTAESYRGSNAESAIGEALAGRRHEVILATKTKAGAQERRTDMMRALEGSLRRLSTDHVDVYFNHAVNDVARMQNEEWREFTDLARRQGKIRFRGMSGHGSHLVECLDYALDADLVDVILVAYNFAQDPSFYDQLRHAFHFVALQPGLPRVLARAKAKDVGVVAMKTLMGARLNDMRPFEWGDATFAQAAFRWVLASPLVDALVISMTSAAEIDEYVGASGGQRVSQADLHLLATYARMHGASYCQPGCSVCVASCPEGVEIAEVLRTRMYAVDYRDPMLASSEYAALGAGARLCSTCVHQACARACPNGVPIAAYTGDAARRLA